MAIVTGAVMICGSIALYVVISSADIVPLPVVILFSIVAFDFFLIIHGIFKIVSYPYIKSVDFIHLVKNGKYTKWDLQFINSCPLQNYCWVMADSSIN